MHNSILPQIFPFLILFCPFSVLLFGIFPEFILNEKPYKYSVQASYLAFGGFIASIFSLVYVFSSDTLIFSHSLGNISIEFLYFDKISAIVLLLISFLLFMVLRFSFNYLKGEPHQGRFTKWLCLTGGSVLIIVISGNLILFCLAWISTSLCLHQLLQFYPERQGALLAARKKFILSRIGDICLIVIIILVFREFHTLNFRNLFDQVKVFHGENRDIFIHRLNPICLLMVGVAMLKSAQFPFHTWLPDTMETPTPVSALMHAGILNAGGFLIIRMGSLIVLSHAAMATLAFFGAITALLGSFVMLTHSSIKRVLAFSTVAQMGFMMLECGLGAFSLALLHLISHSLYKAYAFLNSGTIKSTGKSFLSPYTSKSFKIIPLVLSFLISFFMVWTFSFVLKIMDFNSPPNLVLSTFFSLSIGFFLWNLWSQKWNPFFFFFGLVSGMGICLAYFFLHKVFQEYILVSVSNNFQIYSPLEYILMGFLVFLFVFVLFIQMELPKRLHSPLLSSLYVHARNGFYLNTLFNKWISSLWSINKK